MSMKLSSENEHLVLDNQKLVHYLVRKLGVTPYSSEYEDIVSVGMIGLVKAAITFDSSKKIFFATYASRCINNEIFMNYRKTNKYANNVSFDEPITDDGKGNELTLENTLEDPNSNFIEKRENQEDFIQLVNIVLNYLESKNRIAVLYKMCNMPQSYIAEKLNISQSYVSKITNKSILEIQAAVNYKLHYKEVFSMDIIGDTYKITFASKDISNFNKIFSTLLQNLKSVKTLPDFKVNCNRERIIVQVPAHPESFSFIAQIIQEIDDFSMTFASDKNTLPQGNTVLQKVEADDKDESNDTVEEIESSAIEQNSDIVSVSVNETETVETVKETNTIETIKETKSTTMGQKSTDASTIKKVEETVIKTSTKDNTTKSTIGKITRHTSQSKKIREFILTLDNFSVKQVISEFPDVPTAIVNNAIRLAKTKGLIICVAKDEYVVNKN